MPVTEVQVNHMYLCLNQTITFEFYAFCYLIINLISLPQYSTPPNYVQVYLPAFILSILAFFPRALLILGSSVFKNSCQYGSLSSVTNGLPGIMYTQ